MELSNIQRLFIQTIFNYFHEQGTWPTYGYVEREISQIHRDFDMRVVSRNLPSGFANAFAFNIDRKQEALLKVPAVLLCKGSEYDLTDFVRVLRFCVDKYFSFGENNLQITSDEVKAQLNLSVLSIRKVGRLIEAEGLFWSSLGRNDTEGSWTCALTPGMEGIARFDRVETIEQYLENVDQLKKSFAIPAPQPSINTGVSSYKGQYLMKGMPRNININEGTVSKIKVLFLAANPTNTSPLSLDKEIRTISEKIRASQYRDTLQLESGWAVRPDDLLLLLNEHKPHVVHFSGHGSQAGEIVLVDDKGLSKSVSIQALKALFTTLKDNIQVIVLNACYSRLQAEAITEIIDCIVGMNDAIGDEAAIKFAASFYRAIGFGRSVQEAFDQGKVALLLEGIPEDNKPELLMRAGVDPSRLILVHSPTPDAATEALQKSTKMRLDVYYRGKGAAIMTVGANLVGQEFQLYKNAKLYQRGGKQLVKSAIVRNYPEGNGIYAVVFDGIEPDDYVIEWGNRSWGVTVEVGDVREISFD